MRVSFVGKGGAGKTTIAALFAAYALKNDSKPVVVFDADLNIHAPELLGFEALPAKKHLSSPEVAKDIKTWLTGKNDMPDINAFRKTTPPTRKSNIIRIGALSQTPLSKYGMQRGGLHVFAVGTYEEKEIGTSCYHNNLAIFESVLNHTDDKDGYVVVDMVAGVDAFAGTLHAQFDITCLIVEPTKRSIEVFNKYKELATEAGTYDQVFIIGNKIKSEQDKSFISSHIYPKKVLGYFTEDAHIRNIDQMDGSLNVDKITAENAALLKAILIKLRDQPDHRMERLRKIWDLHRKYVQQGYIKSAFGDLESQIDESFHF